MSIPRGIRNNNPGNIRHGNDWKGLAEEQPDPAFCTFVSPEYGLRAIVVILRNYDRKHGLRTVREFINRWAPPNENDTTGYAEHVARRLGVPVDEEIDVNDYMTGLVKAIVLHENGQQPYSDEQITEAIRLAG